MLRVWQAFQARRRGRAQTAAAGTLDDAQRGSTQGLQDAHQQTLVDPHRHGGLNRRLVHLLMVARVAMAITGFVALLALWDRPLAQAPWLLTVAVLGAVALLTLVAYRHLRKGTSLGATVFTAHLLCDIVLLTVAFHYTGGIENPFVAFYVLPLTLAAYALTWPWLLGAAGVVGLALLSLYQLQHESLTFSREAHEVSGLIAVAVVTYFAYAVAVQSRAHEREVARQREELLDAHGERSRGVVAALAADSISSPLATMSVLVNELQQSRLSSDEHLEALDQLASQIDRCKTSLSELLDSVGAPRGLAGQRRRIDVVLRSAASRCELLDPRLRVEFAQVSGPAPLIVDEPALSNAFVLLIEDLGQIAPHAVQVALKWDARLITVRLRSDVRPEPQDLTGVAARARDAAHGAATELAASLIERFAGRLSRESDSGRSCVTVWLPLSSIGAEAALPNGTAVDRTSVQ